MTKCLAEVYTEMSDLSSKNLSGSIVVPSDQSQQELLLPDEESQNFSNQKQETKLIEFHHLAAMELNSDS